MAVVITKSPSIVNLDAFPIIANTQGEGAPGHLRSVNDSLAAVVGDSIGSLYRLCRIPTDAKIKQVLINYTTGSTAGAGDIGIAFSDSTNDGTNQAFATLANPVVQVTGPVDNKMFGTAKSLISPLVQSDQTFGGTFLPQHMNLPLWQVFVLLGATQFTADPGGFFDLVIKLTTALTVTAGQVSGEVRYVE